MTYLLQCPSLPDFRFEWETERRRVVLHCKGRPPETVAEKIPDPESASHAVSIWCRGYHARAGEAARTNGR